MKQNSYQGCYILFRVIFSTVFWISFSACIFHAQNHQICFIRLLYRAGSKKHQQTLTWAWDTCLLDPRLSCAVLPTLVMCTWHGKVPVPLSPVCFVLSAYQTTVRNPWPKHEVQMPAAPVGRSSAASDNHLGSFWIPISSFPVFGLDVAVA